MEPKREIPPRRLNFSNVTKDPIGKIKRIKSGAIVGDITGGIKNTGKEVGTALIKRSFSDREIIKYSSKGTFLITKLNGDEIRLYEFENRKPVYKRALWSYQMNINQMLTSPDEKYLAVLGSGDTAVSIISLETFEFIDKLPTPGPDATRLKYVFEANSLAFSPDGKFLAVCFNTSKTYVFNVGQVIINLLSNAVKFCPDQGGQVTIQLYPLAHRWRIAVIDNGPGIAPDQHQLIFEKFHQVTDARAGKPKGTGLGLPISQKIVEHHGGSIWVESELGQGASFVVDLPGKTHSE